MHKFFFTIAIVHLSGMNTHPPENKMIEKDNALKKAHLRIYSNSEAHKESTPHNGGNNDDENKYQQERRHKPGCV